MISLKDFNSYSFQYASWVNDNWKLRTTEEMEAYLLNKKVGKKGFRSTAGVILEVKVITAKNYWNDGVNHSYECYVWWIAGVKKPTKEWISLDKLVNIDAMISNLSEDLKDLQDRVDAIKEYI